MDHELNQALETLGQNWSKLPEKDQKFASDLVFKAKNDAPSPKQAYWIKKLAAETALVAVSAQPEAKPTIEVGDVTGVIALFKVAQQHLKF
jgi:hypothetical protein